MDATESADAEQAVIDELAPAYASTSTSLPTNWPPVHIRVLNAGGVQTGLVTDQHRLTLEAFAATETAAGAGLRRALALLASSARDGNLGGEVCYDLTVIGLPQNLPLPSVPNRKRYLATITAALRRRPVTT